MKRCGLARCLTRKKCLFLLFKIGTWLGISGEENVRINDYGHCIISIAKWRFISANIFIASALKHLKAEEHRGEIKLKKCLEKRKVRKERLKKTYVYWDWLSFVGNKLLAAVDNIRFNMDFLICIWMSVGAVSLKSNFSSFTELASDLTRIFLLQLQLSFFFQTFQAIWRLAI